jgi:hypothetical protein
MLEKISDLNNLDLFAAQREAGGLEYMIAGKKAMG